MVQKCKQIYCDNIKVTFEQNEGKSKSEKKENDPWTIPNFFPSPPGDLILPFSNRFKPIGFLRRTDVDVTL